MYLKQKNSIGFQSISAVYIQETMNTIYKSYFFLLFPNALTLNNFLGWQVLWIGIFSFLFDFPAVRFEPGTAGCEARTLPLCYAVPPAALLRNIQQSRLATDLLTALHYQVFLGSMAFIVLKPTTSSANQNILLQKYKSRPHAHLINS